MKITLKLPERLAARFFEVLAMGGGVHP